MRARWQRLTESARTGFWAVPALCVVLAALLALVMIEVDRELETRIGGPLTLGGGPDGAREVLSAITGAMITFTGLIFSITIVVLQLTSSQFSPRVLRTFLRDRQTQISMGVFVSTFVYAVLVLRSVSGQDDDEFVPALATTGGIVLLLASVGVFVAYIHHIATAIQVSSVIDDIAGETQTVLERQIPTDTPPAQPVLRPHGEASLVVPAPRSGVLLSVQTQTLARLACEADVVIVSDVHLGDFVPEGAPLLEIRGADVDQCDVEAARRAFALGKERTMQQDVAFGLRQLVDIAERALSTGVNDPTTAVQALDGLHDALRRLATRHLPNGVTDDEHGRMRVFLPPVRLEDLLALALDEIEQYGESSLQVQARIDALLTDVRAAALPEHRPALDARIAARAESGLRG